LEAASVSPELELGAARRSAVDAAREGWIRRLIDLSRRNNLLFFRDLKTGTVDLSGATGQAMMPFLQGESVPLSEFVARDQLMEVSGKIREIRRRALSNLEERGLETLFLAMGMASWEPADQGRPTEAAVLLIPTELELRGREGRSLNLRRKGDIQVNLVLIHVLEVEHGVIVTADAMLEALQGDDEGESFDPSPVYELLRRAAEDVPGFTVRPRLVLGNFAFQKTAMVRDLQAFGDEMTQHDLIAAIAGDAQARASIQQRRTPADPQDIDRAPPESEHLILDADSSQQLVIRQALGAQDGVVHGPPGTGKSQTIANMIAEFAAQGRRVLFVAEKRAALEVVLERLRQTGLGHLALDLHGAEVSRREVMAKFAESLMAVRLTPTPDAEPTHARFAQRRKRMVDHVVRIHAVRPPSGMSVYDMQGRLLRLERDVRSTTRWRGEQLQGLDRAQADSIRDLLEEASAFAGLFLRSDSSPWTGWRLKDGRAVEQAIDTVKALSKRWPALETVLALLREESGFAEARTLAEVRTQLSLLSEVSDTLAVYSGSLFSSTDLRTLVAALLPASHGAPKRFWALLSDKNYREALRTARALRQAGRAKARQLLDEASTALDQSERWQRQCVAVAHPHPTPLLENARLALQAVDDCLAGLSPKFAETVPDQMALAAIGDWVSALASDAATPHRLPRLLALESELIERGAEALILELRQTRPPFGRCADTFEHAWLSSCMDLARSTDPALAGFDGRSHDRIAEEFRRLDKQRIRLASDRVRRAHAERVIEVMNANPTQEALVRREAAKKARHLSIRRLVAEAAPVLTALRPCWMASPLSVSHLLPTDRQLFDVVLFDEASQVLPEDAVPALLRGKNAIVAGDRCQLPPTTFFVAGDDEDSETESDAATQGFESILDLMSGLIDPWPLDWHYRSRDETLIAFSNRHIYDGRLVTFPGPITERALEHVLVTQAENHEGQEESVSAEVRRVVELVLDHAAKRPDETLGVIALGIKHANRIEGAVEDALRSRPDLDGFFDQSRSERFFVKNLERVQGDERDAIILTVGYGKDSTGRLLYRFGPLLMQGGERRLNVAITRARNRMTVVSSFSHHDMDPSRSKARGVELLRLYLDYAASGGSRLGQESTSGFALNAFERDVFDALTDKGIALLPQWGASRYRIDLVAQHPAEPGRLVLAIECDGAAYHSAYSARDRDRLRQQHLEALGWRFHRIWSTDWFTRRDDEVARALAAFQEAVRAADRRGDAHGERAPRSATQNAAALTASSTRGRRPHLGQRPSITDYSHEELERLVRWIQSDDQLRTDDELLEEAIDELGFDRRGSRIVAAIREAIEACRGQ
jgi:very-short-patch-repair endonuclease